MIFEELIFDLQERETDEYPDPYASAPFERKKKKAAGTVRHKKGMWKDGSRSEWDSNINVRDSFDSFLICLESGIFIFPFFQEENLHELVDHLNLPDAKEVRLCVSGRRLRYDRKLGCTQ